MRFLPVIVGIEVELFKSTRDRASDKNTEVANGGVVEMITFGK